MGRLDIGFGTSLLGSWFGSLLCGAALAQTYEYFKIFPNDIGEYVDVYMPTVTFWGNPAALLDETWSVPLYTISNALVAIIVNSYLISRFYSVSKNIVVTVFLFLVTLLAFVMSFLPVLLYPGVANIQKAVPLALVWTIASAVSDVLIAASLVWTLRGMKTTFTDTNRLVRRVMIISIQNGCTTSVLAIGGMISTIIIPYSNVAEVFFFQLGPLYVLTLLSNFNLRGAGKSGSRTWSSSRNNNTMNSSIVIDAAQMRRPAIVTKDSDIEMGNRKGEERTVKQDPFRAEGINYSST
ncbi:hypothetical protein MVEN_00209600 [Mycena venus]|uniref:DUF6534 domain-containing protein n=1 Tax=Mycena venus TaxID=2733690 RepID=A0A8H6Z1B2_9AGAR|nr:hypothetical protein MVEN_00209600 [Mycena venus]